MQCFIKNAKTIAIFRRCKSLARHKWALIITVLLLFHNMSFNLPLIRRFCFLNNICSLLAFGSTLRGRLLVCKFLFIGCCGWLCWRIFCRCLIFANFFFRSRLGGCFGWCSNSRCYCNFLTILSHCELFLLHWRNSFCNLAAFFWSCTRLSFYHRCNCD